MQISIITLFPAMISGFFNESIVQRAQEKGLVKIELINLRDFSINSYKSVDDSPYGGGAGMVLRVEPIYKALQKVKSQKFPAKRVAYDPVCGDPALREKVKSSNERLHKEEKVIITSPKGTLYTQKKAQEYVQLDHLIIIAGHYEGVDERVMCLVDEEISCGDFVLTGGEIVASAITDSVVRLLPGVLKKQDATHYESFLETSVKDLIDAVGNDGILVALRQRGVSKIKLLEYPQYTRPETFRTMKVPDILLSGDHQAIERWRLKMAYEVTRRKRKDLLE